MSEAQLQRARILACHAWVFRRHHASEYDALRIWNASR